MLRSNELEVVLAECDKAARALRRRLRMPIHALEDLRQDILLDVVTRLHRFNPARGTLGAFSSHIARNRAKRLSARLSRRPPQVSIDDLLAETLEKSMVEHGLLAPYPAYDDVDLAMDVRAIVQRLAPHQQLLCSRLVEGTPTELHKQYGTAKSTIYRQIAQLRKHMIVVTAAERGARAPSRRTPVAVPPHGAHQ